MDSLHLLLSSELAYRNVSYPGTPSSLLQSLLNEEIAMAALQLMVLGPHQGYIYRPQCYAQLVLAPATTVLLSLIYTHVTQSESLVLRLYDPPLID